MSGTVSTYRVSFILCLKSEEFCRHKGHKWRYVLCKMHSLKVAHECSWKTVSLTRITPATSTSAHAPCVAHSVLREWCLYHRTRGGANGMRTDKIWQCSHEREAFQNQGTHERLALRLLLLLLSLPPFVHSIFPPHSLPHPSFLFHYCTFRLKLWMLTRLLATLN